MKKNYFGRMFLMTVFGLVSNFLMAQGVWKVNSAKSVNPVPCEQKKEAGTIYLGYTGPDAYIYPYDGLSIDVDSKVGVAIKLPREKFAAYIGGKLSALMVGWDTSDMNGEAEIFVRTSFDGENLSTGKGEICMGWNTVSFDKAVAIPDVDTLVLGYYTFLKAGVIGIPKVYPLNQEHSCYLWMDGDTTEDGKERWLDAKDIGTMTILGVVNDETGAFNNLLELQNSRFDQIIKRDSVGTAFVQMRNIGSNNINEVEVTSEFEGKTWNMVVPLGKGIAPSTSGKVYLPYCALGSGQNQFYISKVNGVENKNVNKLNVNLLTVPQDVASQYTLHHLLEFWTSENSYMHITYFELYTRPNLEKYGERMTLVNQHADDQFMTGEEDDVSRMMLDFVNNDSMRVFIPSMSLNRNRYVINRAADDSGPLFPVFFPEYGDMVFNELMDEPTFASVNVDAKLSDDSKKASVVVSGNVAEGVMPKDEPLYLTVYLMEYDVESDSQIFWDEAQKAEYGGIYKHYNVIRQILTPIYGNKLAKTGGEYSQNFEVDIDETWNAANMGVVAFLNRGIENTNFERQVINSCEKRFAASTGVELIESSVEESPVAIYNMAGVRVDGFTGKGVYLVKSTKNGKPVVRKVMVK